MDSPNIYISYCQTLPYKKTRSHQYATDRNVNNKELKSKQECAPCLSWSFSIDISLNVLLVSSSRNKKKKIPLMNGEEVDMDLSAME